MSAEGRVVTHMKKMGVLGHDLCGHPHILFPHMVNVPQNILCLKHQIQSECRQPALLVSKQFLCYTGQINARILVAQLNSALQDQ